MKYFFVMRTWGVSTAWLQQMSRRLVTQFGSFTGEAKVHWAAAQDTEQSHVVPGKSYLKLLRAWLLWRLVWT